jgi:hypothetical protein
MSLSNDAENLALKWLFTDTSVTRPTAWYVSLHSDNPGETGANEITTGTDADYIRKSTTFTDATSGSCSNESAVTWTVDSASSGYTIRYAGVWTAETNGTFLGGGALYSEHAVVANSVSTFAIGDITVSID